MKNVKFNFKSIVRSKARWLLTLIAILTLGVGQMWADPWVKLDVSTGSQGTKTVGDKLNGGSDWWFNYQTNGGWSTGTDIQVLIGTSSSSYSTVDASWYKDDGDNKKVHANIGSFTFDKSGIWYAVGKYKSGSTTAYTSGTSFTNNTSLSTSMSTSNSPYWTVNPPAVSDFSVARSGYLAGSGTSEDPYLVASGSTLTLTGSGSKAKSDANSSVNYKFGSDAYSTTATKNITVTSSGSIAVKARCINSSASLNGTETSAITIYYAPVSVKDISVYIYVGGHSEGEINSVEMNGCTPYVGTKALAAVKINNRSAGEPKFTLSGNWLVYTFTNVTKVSNITCARSGGNIFTGEITDNVYYTYEGTSLPGQCIQPANPTWGTAPASGAIGGSMTATVSGAPDGATITWSSTATSYATVNSSGVISYEAAGSATIKANVSWDASGDYCSGSYELSQAITVTSGATVSVTRTCPEYVSTAAGQVTLDISSTGASTGWYYRIWNGSGYEGPDNVNASSNSASWTMTGGVPEGARTYTVELYDGSNVKQATSSGVTITGETAHITYIAAGSNGSVSPTTIYANNNHVHPTITATANDHYHFENWTSNNASASVASTTSATTTVTASAGGYTITANFAGDQYSITYKDQGDVAFSGSHVDSPSSHPTTHTYGAATTLNSATKTGYSFGGWFTTSNCASGTDVTSLGATAYTSNITLYAKWTEVMSSLSTSCSYDAGDPEYSVPSKSASSIGISTTADLTAAAPSTGYTFVGWTLTHCVRTSGEANSRNITVRSDGSGEAATAVANYEEDLTTTWYIAGDRNGTGTDLTPGSPFAGWGTSGTRMSKKSGHSTEEIYYCTITVSTVATTDDHFPFKVYNSTGSQYYGNNGYWVTKENNHPTLSSTSGSNMKFRPYVTGTYEFKLDNTGANPVLTVTWPVFNQVRISAASPSDAGNVGNYDLSEPVSNVRTVTRSLKANTTYTFKVVYNSDWYGHGTGTFTRSNSTSSNSRTLITSSGNLTLTTDYAGDYTFKFNQSTKALSVDFPTAYKITFGKGSVDGTTGSFSAVDLDNGSSAVTSNSTWVKSGDDVKITAPDAKSGYRFLGWYNNNSATGDAITTNANCTISVTSATTVYACYAENLTSITVSAGTGGTVTTGSGTSNLGVTTTKAINASANPGYTWSTWTISGTAALGTTATTASNTAKGDGTNGSTGTITATFTPNPYTITLKKHNGQSDGSINVTFDANTNLTGTAVTAPTKTGYTFGGYYTGESGAGTKIINADGTVVASASDASYTYTDASKNWKYPNNITLHAKWDANTYSVTLDYDETNHGDITTTPPTGSVTATYDAAMPAIAKLPKAAEGYAFMGYFSEAGGNGTQYYDGIGASVTNWNVDDEITLYAYYKKAEITNLALDATTVETNGTVGVTPTVSPTPTGDTKLCFYVFHSNDNLLDPQPEISWNGTKATFNAGAVSGTYKVGVSLRTGTSCGGGTLLDSTTVEYQVAGSHTVTVNYTCGDDVIKAATSLEGIRPLDWSDDITAPDIFGYTFARWDAADGVTIKNGESTPVTTSTDATIKIKATYNGKLTAVYTQKSMIFFKNTLGWSDVYVNFYTEAYWNNPKGSGNQGKSNCNLHMSQIDDTDIWYYDYGAASISPSLYVSFTSASQSNMEFFWKSGGVNVVYPANYPDAINTDKSSETGFKAATPMFVPLATQDKVTLNQSSGGKADYYNAGYWTKYTSGTGYTLEIYNSAGISLIKSAEFTSADELMPMKAVVDLEGGTTYKFQLKRSGDIYYGNSGTMTYANHGSPTPWDMTNGSFSMCGITTNAAGDYTFNLSYSGNSSTPPHYRLRMAVDYPIADGDYRLIYKDAVHTNWHPSAIVSKGNDRKDTVSFFVRPGSSPEMKIQTATVNPSTGAVTWGSDEAISTATLTGLTSTDVYNFNLSMDGSGNISLESVDTYTGNFYIRTDAANSKWDNYKSDPDHRMTYSEYSIEHGGYTHYYCHWVDKDDAGRKNVKFCIANDYSPCISDTLIREEASGTWANINDFMTTGGDLKRSANVRFMWDKRDNTISRAYVDGAQGDYSTNFLYMLNVEAGADKIKNGDGSALTDHKVTFKDNGNWMYEANIKAQPTAQIKLLSNWGTSPTITQYFRGASDTTETLIGGSGENWYDIRLIYDFKTNRLIAGLIPSGTIDEQMAIHADVMFVREHQGDIAQLTFTEKAGKMGAITDIETAFGVLQFNKWTLNNKSKADGHAPLSQLLSAYERDLFYVSFPFKVSMEEVFGFGTYGTHWIIEEYDGASRAANGYWLESGPNWKFVFNRKNKFFEPGQGYIIALDLDELGESSSVWANTDQVELYFPSYGTMDNITSSTATYEIPSHLCTINRSEEIGGSGNPLGSEYDRRVKDSHWNVLGVPTYVNPDAPNYANTDWITEATETSIGPNFLYEWNMDDNSVSAVSASGYTYHAMHAYLVQYCGNVTWTSSVSVKPSAPAARRNPDYRGEYEFRLALQQNDQTVDQTFVKLSDDEAVTTGFEFNYDLSKEFNKNKANIYTLIGSEQVAGNVLPLTEQTTVVPVGVSIQTAGDYTFSLPDGTEGIGVTLIDNQTGMRTRLSALDYTVNLTAGTINGRFTIEISPIAETPTDIEVVSDQNSAVRKVMIDGILYIVKGNRIYDATGALVK